MAMKCDKAVGTAQARLCYPEAYVPAVLLMCTSQRLTSAQVDILNSTRSDGLILHRLSCTQLHQGRCGLSAQ